MKNYKHIFYLNGNFDNKGCEAITRGATEILRKKKQDISTCTTDIVLDKSVIEELGIGYEIVPRIRESFLNMISAFFQKIRLKKIAISIPFPKYKKIGKRYDYLYSMGGDNYCYPGQETYYRINKNLKNKKNVSVFWGCSIEKDLIDKNMLKDLKRYDYIFPRESITYKALNDLGLQNVIKCTDPAFVMKAKECNYPGMEADYIGINISPLTLSCNNNPEQMFDNLVYAIKGLMDETRKKILLIPHVYGAGNDYYVHKRIYEKLKSSDAFLLEELYDAQELKYIISRSSFFIGARTHATIAAYSTCVPTLVLGYSVKADGIATDLFGTCEGFVLRVQNNYTKEDLLKFFIDFYKKNEEIKKTLVNIMPKYIENAYKVLEILGDYNENR